MASLGEAKARSGGRFAWPVLWIATSVWSCGGHVVAYPTPLWRVEDVRRRQAELDYKINVGDELEVQFFYAPELTTRAVVRPDGKISLPFIGDVKAAQQEPAKLATSLKGLYASQLPRPELSVNVRSFSAQRVFVGGEVGQPGMQPLSGPMTVMQAIMAAHGFTERALTQEIVIIRRGEGRERLVFAVNTEKAITGEDANQDIALQASDIVIVPRSGVANVNLWVDQYIRRMLPFSLYAGYNLDARFK
jgi:polysaccharide biosynthesis/export protein